MSTHNPVFTRLTRRGRALRLIVPAAIFSLFMLLAASSFGVPAAQAAGTIVVDGTTCTLADAITAANTDTATGGCPAGSGADSIDLQTDVTLTSGLPDITSELTLNGNGHTIARDSAASNFRILFVNSGGNLTLNRATLANGIAQEYPLTSRPIGGGLLNYGATTINDSIIRDNGAFTGGGGLANYHYATLTINNSTIRNNGPNGVSYLGGAGILNWGGTVTINNSTVSNNSGGEAIRNWRIKDGSVADSFTTIRNSTIRAVSGERALNMLGGGNITVDSSTIVGQSTRSYEYLIVAAAGGTTPGNASIVMRNSIAFDMASGTRAPVCLTSAVSGATATITSDGHNLVSDASCGFTATGDQQSVSAANLKLGPLADNGGPTQTYALLPGSVAIDAGDTTLTTDQRGEARPYGPADDIGAFELTTPATVIIEKRTAPAGGVDFGFVITDTQGVTSTFTLSDTERYTVTNAAPGTYVVVEDEFFSGRLANIQCNDANGASPSTVDLATRTANINVSLGETVTCTFTNAEDDFIIIHKSTYPVGGAGFDFTSNIPGGANFTLDHDEEEFFAVTSGTYTITETNPGPLWELGAIDCTVLAADPNDPPTSVSGDLQTGSVTLDLPDPGQLAYCVFTNLGLSSITIEKDARPADNTDFNFSSPQLGSFSLNGTSPVSQTFDLVSGGIYTITEAATSGWVLDGINCQSTSGNSFFDVDLTNGQLVLDLDEGDDVTCTFNNEKPGSITIIKDADPADDTPFDFTITGGISDTFTLSDPSVISTTFSALTSGDYQVTELLPAGWELQFIQCQHDPNTIVGINYNENRAYIVLAAGDDLVCTFNNEKPGSITIVKDADPADGTVFNFSGDLGDFSLNSSTAPSTTFPLLGSGSYIVVETLDPDWVLTDITCVGNDQNSSFGYDRSQGKAEIYPAPGDDVVCTFTNKKVGSITIVKDADPADGTVFNFSGDLGDFSLNSSTAPSTTFPLLGSGSYIVVETLDPDWVLTDITCVGNDQNSSFGYDRSQGKAEIYPAPGDDVVCTFANSKRGTIIIAKLAVGGDDTFGFTGDVTTTGAFSLTTVNGQALQSFANLAPGTYAVTETAKANWTLAPVTCSDGSTPDNINLDAGETVVCGFLNLKQDTIIVKKVSVGGDGRFDFTSNIPNHASFALTTTNGTTSTALTNLAPGVYSIVENTPPGWNLTGATCDNGDRPDNVSLGVDQTITCVFTNTRAVATITIIKEATPKSTQNFNFSAGPRTPLVGVNEGGVLTPFILDDAVPDDRDLYPKSRSFTLPGGVYTFGEQTPSNWYLKAIDCSAANGSSFSVSLPNVVITLGGGDVTCTFKNELSVTIQTLKYQDTNGNGVRNSGEPALASWTITATLQPSGTARPPLTTNSLGRANFSFIPAGTYKVCEVMKPGWVNTQPGGASPCYTLTLTPGQTASVLFGNRASTAVSVAENEMELAPLSPYPGVTISDGDPNAIDGYTIDLATWVDENLLTPMAEPVEEAAPVQRVYLPTVTR